MVVGKSPFGGSNQDETCRNILKLGSSPWPMFQVSLQPEHWRFEASDSPVTLAMLMIMANQWLSLLLAINHCLLEALQ